ncbi:carbohydrate kinase family protein [Vulcanisaeta sp. JCM 16159]|uniref:carbohydrate kinase family protein n=1 Tax=Vulcanisaeta sp. JCM 16159 TaxID=1295371 RepID=UPI0006CFD1BC|nr:carbohydrate kinase family protein [Vulcanisaeta sp. JCM 16159]
MNNKPIVLSIGHLNLDIYVKTDAIPRPDESVDAYETYMGGGGSAANFSVAVARLRLGSRFLGSVGNDQFGDMLIKELETEGVDTRFIKRISHERTGTVIVIVGLDGSKRMIRYSGANLGLTPSDVDTGAMNGVSHIHVALGRTEIIEASKRIARSMGLTISVDGGTSLAKKGLDVIRDVMNDVDIWFMNSFEAKELGHSENVVRAAENIASKVRVRELIVTLGPRGALLLRDNEVKYSDAFKVPPVDTTGAGDTFAAAYVVASILDLDPIDKLVFANAAASLKVTRRGARSSPRLNEVVEFLESLGYAKLANEVMNRLGST